MSAGSSGTLRGRAKVGGLCGIEVRHRLVGDSRILATGKIILAAEYFRSDAAKKNGIGSP